MKGVTKIINIEHHTLEKFTPVKLLEPSIKFVRVHDEVAVEKAVDTVNAQLKCDQVKYPFARSALLSTKVVDARVLADDEAETCQKQVFEIILDAKPFADIELQPGDTIGILPHNELNVVQKVLHALGMEASADECYEMRATTPTKAAKLPAHIPHLVTPREVLRDCLNLHAVPKKQLLRALADCCTDAHETNFLNCLSSKEGSSEYNSLILQGGLRFLQLLELCATCRPTLATLVEFLPRLLPRPYSIANSPLARPNEISVIFSLLLAEPGLTSSYMAKLAKDRVNNSPLTPTLLVYVREATKFRYTASDVCHNQVLICIGTALAPFMGFLEHKAALKDKEDLGETWLFAGATHRSKVVYRERWQEWSKTNILNQYREAISREILENDGKHCKHVQDIMVKDSEKLVQFLQKPDTDLYVCADGAHISADINKCLSECLQKELHMDANDVGELLKEWRKSGKYKEDIWL